MNYIVMSPGRTGATLIVNNLNNLSSQEISYVEHRPPMMSTRDQRFQKQNQLRFDPLASTPILSRRRYIFDAVLSLVIMGNTNEAQNYTDTKYPSFVFPKEKFMLNYMYYVNFYDQIDLSLYKTDPITLYFEDVIEDPFYLFKSIGIERETNYSLCKKSPHGRELISNLDELVEVCRKQRWPVPNDI